jgi:Kef-type K+ transport system membrane component KefB
MESYKYLLDIALILISTKILGLLTRRIQLPQVVGALIAGLLLGPACFGVLQETDFIKNIAEIGVIVLMFAAGLETDVQELKKTGLASFIIALLGVIVPLVGGYFVATIYNPVTDQQTMLQNIFVGVVLTATSVSITVETLKELGKLSTKTGNAILGAALIDDVLGIIALTVISSFAGSDVSLWVILLKILGFFVFCGVVAFLFIKFVNPWINKYKKDLRRFVILAFAFCLLMSFSAEYFFGVSDITGAFVAGLILSNNKKTSYMLNRFDTVSYVLLSPVFFASVGLKVTFSNMSATVVVLTVLLLVVAILSKMIGCGLGAKICKYTNLQSVKIGIGMISRGEVALIVATKGMSMGLMKDEFFAPLVLVVVATTIVTPILLKLAYKYQASREADVPMASSLVDKVEERNDLEKITQNAANMHEEMKEIHK